MRKTFTLELTKVIVTKVEAKSYKEACLLVKNGQVPDLDESWDKAESKVVLLSEAGEEKSVVSGSDDSNSLIASLRFGEPQVMYDHGISTAEQAKQFRSGELALPGREPEKVTVKFHSFQFNAPQNRTDAVFTVIHNGKSQGFFFASTFKSLDV